MRSYFTLLRLPYQLQLGPIFGWGYLLGGGHLTSWSLLLWFLVIFSIFHVGAFGGLTALNSFYDRDTGPVGGLWQPPAPPASLLAFAWTVQLAGLIALLAFSWPLACIYTFILVLSVIYSHPLFRWKGHPWRSLAIVVVGQGILDFLAGALTVDKTLWGDALWWGMAGATLTVAGFYPLTQLFQVEDDTARHDYTLAAHLVAQGGRGGVFRWAEALLTVGLVCNCIAVVRAGGHPVEAALLLVAGLLSLARVWRWNREAEPTPRGDFQQVHALMRRTALAFAAYILIRLTLGGF